MYADQKKVRQNQQPSNKLHLLHFLFERCGLMMMMVDDGEGEREIPFDKSIDHITRNKMAFVQHDYGHSQKDPICIQFTKYRILPNSSPPTNYPLPLFLIQS